MVLILWSAVIWLSVQHGPSAAAEENMDITGWWTEGGHCWCTWNFAARESCTLAWIIWSSWTAGIYPKSSWAWKTMCSWCKLSIICNYFNLLFFKVSFKLVVCSTEKYFYVVFLHLESSEKLFQRLLKPKWGAFWNTFYALKFFLSMSSLFLPSSFPFQVFPFFVFLPLCFFFVFLFFFLLELF